ncbi:MAG: single-strand DNA-binding protein, partial [Myxococcota bacterium]
MRPADGSPGREEIMVNKVILLGNLGRDPESRTTKSGTTVANLNIATNERQKDREGNWNDHTEWHRVACFGRTAENVAKYLRKGRQVYVEGRIRTRKWQDDKGQDRYSTEIIADRIQFIGGREGGGAGGDGYSSGG